MIITLSNTLQLHPVAIGDQPKLYRLIESIYPPAYKHLWVNEDCSFYVDLFYSKKQFEVEHSETDNDYYFVVYNQECVGVIRVLYNQISPDKSNKNSTYINRIYLGAQAQGKGVAQQLFHWIIQRATQHNNSLLWLKAMDTQTQALRFYKKEGFTITGRTSLDFELLLKPFRGMVIMQKELNSF